MLTKNDRRYCVYTLRYRGIPFYIGKGLPGRPQKHYQPAERRKNHPKNDFINNFDTYITIERDGLTNEEANAFEKQLIEVWGFENLTNKTRGGSGTDGFKDNPETKAIKSEAKSGEKNPQYGMTGEKSPRFGKNHTPETRAKQSEAKSGENNPSYDDTVYNFQHKDGRIETCTQWALRTKYNLHPGHLSEVVSGKGRRKSCGGWSSF